MWEEVLNFDDVCMERNQIQPLPGTVEDLRKNTTLNFDLDPNCWPRLTY